MSNYYVYIMTNKPRCVLYFGVTNNLAKRAYEHKNNITAGFTSKYKLHKLVCYEYTDDVSAAIAHEKRLNRSFATIFDTVISGKHAVRRPEIYI